MAMLKGHSPVSRDVLTISEPNDEKSKKSGYTGEHRETANKSIKSRISEVRYLFRAQTELSS